MTRWRLSRTGRSGSTLRLIARASPTQSIRVRSGLGLAGSASATSPRRVAPVPLSPRFRPSSRLAHLAELRQRDRLVGVGGHGLGAVEERVFHLGEHVLGEHGPGGRPALGVGRAAVEDHLLFPGDRQRDLRREHLPGPGLGPRPGFVLRGRRILGVLLLLDIGLSLILAVDAIGQHAAVGELDELARPVGPGLVGLLVDPDHLALDVHVLGLDLGAGPGPSRWVGRLGHRGIAMVEVEDRLAGPLVEQDERLAGGVLALGLARGRVLVQRDGPEEPDLADLVAGVRVGRVRGDRRGPGEALALPRPACRRASRPGRSGPWPSRGWPRRPCSARAVFSCGRLGLLARRGVAGGVGRWWRPAPGQRRCCAW